MCGLVGIASSNLVTSDRSVFTTLLYLDELRGEHSTGVAAVNKNGDVAVYKRALKASDFIQLKGYSSTILKADKVLMGHNRYATMGAKDDNNAHPFTHGGITLMHNGTLTNKTAVATDKEFFSTDSETVAYALSCEDTKEVLERLEGAYALVWYDEEDETLCFARNDQRPLYIGYIGNDLVWASEKAMLELVAEHHKKTVKNIVMLDTGKLVMFDINHMSNDPVIIEFIPKKPPVIQNYGNNYGQGNRNFAGKRNRHTHYQGPSVTIEATLTECRETGYFTAITDDGALVSGNIPTSDVIEFTCAASTSKRIQGTVRSTSDRWHEGEWVEMYHLNGNTVEIIEEKEEEVADSGTEKKSCQLCGSSSTTAKNGTYMEIEYHMGDFFHTKCLDEAHKFNRSFY